MKTISSDLNTHLSGEVTTIASCWKIIRRDGQVFYFTDHDRDITFEGNTYSANNSYDRTAVQSRSDFGVDNLEVAGIIDSSTITDQDIRAGLFNRAQVFVFIVNWKTPSQGALKVRRGWFGEVQQTHTGSFSVEIRGLAEALSTNFMEVYSATCRTDFCSPVCGLLITAYEISTTVATSVNRYTLTLDPGFSPPAQGLVGGTVRFTSGSNSGRVVEIVGYNNTTKQVDLFEGVSYAIAPADTVVVAPGCDKSLTACKGYSNVINRQAEDYVPGNDELIKYPDAHTG